MRIELSSEAIGSTDMHAGINVVPFDGDTHAAAARELLNAAYRNGGGEVLALDQWWPNLIADPEFDQELLFVLIDEHNSEMLAFAQVWNTGFIKDFAVRPSSQRKGIGRALLNHIFHSLRERGLHDCSLKVLADNPTNAPAFYRANGMEVIEPV